MQADRNTSPGHLAVTAAEVIEHAYLRYHACEISLVELRAVLADFGVKVDRAKIAATAVWEPSSFIHLDD